MTLPDVVVTTVNQNPVIDQAEAVHQLFLVAPAQKGPTVSTRCGSFNEVAAVYGDRVGYSLLIDAAKSYFKETGDGASVVVTRVVGPSAVKATLTLNNSTPAPVIVATAASFGAWANSLRLQVIVSGGTYVLVLSHSTLGELARSGSLADIPAGLAFLNATGYVTAVASTGSGNPATLAATALTGGTDDNTNIVDASYQIALDAIDVRLGPGLLSIPGATTTTLHTAALAHGDARNRRAFLDLVDTATAGTLTTEAVTLRALSTSGKGASFAPWLTTPDGFQVPPGPAAAGLYARQVLKTGNPNQPAAGDLGELQWHTGLTHDLEASREVLNDAGVNVLRNIDGQGTYQLYGYRTLANPITDSLELELSNVLLDMLVVARGKKIGATEEFKQIDGKGLLASIYAGKLTAMLSELYQLGALFGDTPADAFQVDAGPSINTPVTAAAGLLKAKIALRRSPFAEVVELEITNFSVSEVIS